MAVFDTTGYPATLKEESSPPERVLQCLEEVVISVENQASTSLQEFVQLNQVVNIQARKVVVEYWSQVVTRLLDYLSIQMMGVLFDPIYLSLLEEATPG